MASHENDKAMDGLLRRSLAHDSAVTGDCPDAEILAAYYDRSLGLDEAAAYDLHFSLCSRCREQLAAMARADVAQEAEVSLDPVLVATHGNELRVAAQAAPAALHPARTPASEKPHSHSWLDLRWLAPVA